MSPSDSELTRLEAASSALLACLTPDRQLMAYRGVIRLMADLLDPIDLDHFATERLNRLPTDVP